MPDAASAAYGVYRPRRPQASVIDPILAHRRARAVCSTNRPRPSIEMPIRLLYRKE